MTTATKTAAWIVLVYVTGPGLRKTHKLPLLPHPHLPHPHLPHLPHLHRG